MIRCDVCNSDMKFDKLSEAKHYPSNYHSGWIFTQFTAYLKERDVCNTCLKKITAVINEENESREELLKKLDKKIFERAVEKAFKEDTKTDADTDMNVFKEEEPDLVDEILQ